MSLSRIRCFLFLVFFLSATSVFLMPLALAQSADTAGLEIYVHDPSGALVPDAQLTLEQTDTHAVRQAVADAAGHFRFADLPVGPYKLSVSKVGFKGYEQTGLNLLAGQVPTLQIKIPLGNASDNVVVNADVPIINTEQTTIGQNISQTEIENLPSDGRNFLDFALTVPGATSQATSGQGSGVVFNGQRARSNNILIDGVENNGQLNGTVRQTLSIDAIAQFLVMTAQFQPEYGNAGGGLVNILTKTGTNDFHGDLYYFARRQWMNSYPIVFAGGTPFKPIYVQNDFGGTLGGPIKKGKTFFFASAEYIGFNTNQSSAISGTNIATINQDLTTHPLGGSSVRLSGSPINVVTATTTASMRIDHTFGPKDSLYARFLYGQYTRANPSLDRNDGTLSDVSNYGFDTYKAVGTTLVETHIFTPTIINEARFQYAPQFLTQHPQSFGPDVYISGVAQFGQNTGFPTILNESHYEWYDALTISKSRHLYKFGADANFVRGYSSYPVDRSGFFDFSGLTPSQSANYNFNAAQPFSYDQSFGNPNIQLPDWLLSGFAEDSWKITPNLTMNYGVRYDLDLQPQGYNGDRTNPIQVPLPKGIPRDYNNVSPRIGLAYSPFKSGKTVVRAGYGFFYDKIFLLVARNSLLAVEDYHLQSPLVTGPQAAELRSIYANGPFANSNVYPTDPLATAPSINSIPAALPIPYAQESNLTIDQQLSKNWSLELSYIHVDATDELKSANINLQAPTIVTAANSLAVAGTATPSYQQLLRPYYPTAKANPAYTNIQQVGSNGHSRYDGFVGSMIHRTTQSLTLRANWTWSKTIDDGSDFTQAQQPDNPFVPSAERSLGLEDQRNRFAGSAVYKLPTPAGAIHSVKVVALGNWITSVTAIANSGTPYNATVGTDVNDDGNSGTDRPYYPGAPGVVMRRNNFRGPRFQTVGFRLQKEVPLRGAMRLRGSVEAFNLFNHTNYLVGGIYSVWGTAATPRVGVYNQLPGSPNTAPGAAYIYAFSAPETAGDTRHLQLGVKFYF